MAEVEYNTAVTVLKGIQSKLSLLGLNLDKLMQGEIQPRFTLKAPISGSVNKLEVAIGQHVNPSEEIYEMVNIDHLHLELNIFEKDVIKVKKGQRVRFIVSGIDNQEFTGVVFLVGNDLSENKRSINVHVHLDVEEGPFTVGMYASATIAVSDHQTYTLPTTALVVEDSRVFVFKKVSSSTEGITFRKVPVKTGIEASGLVEIADLDELMPEDEIVTKGAFYLLNAFSGGI